ncbi:MAG: hypothetical protein ACRDGQ_08600, partial [Candidatus Limnocylindrales bacterium]
MSDSPEAAPVARDPVVRDPGSRDPVARAANRARVSPRRLALLVLAGTARLAGLTGALVLLGLS